MALAYGTTACSSVRHVPLTRTKPSDQVTVQSGQAFAVHGSSGLACATYRASGTVDGISSDTVWLRSISNLSTRSGEPPECAALRMGWFVVSGEPSPDILRRDADLRKTTLLVVGVAAAFVVFSVIVTAAAFPSSGSYCDGGTCY